MPQTQATYGFGFSPISLENKDKAFADEMFAVKNAGILGILYGENKVPISANIINRAKASLDNIIKQTESLNLVGDLYQYTPENGIILDARKNQVSGNFDTNFSDGYIYAIINEDIEITKSIKNIYVYTDAQIIDTETGEYMTPKDVLVLKGLGTVYNNDTEYTSKFRTFCGSAIKYGNSIVKLFRSDNLEEEQSTVTKLNILIGIGSVIPDGAGTPIYSPEDMYNGAGTLPNKYIISAFNSYIFLEYNN